MAGSEAPEQEGAGDVLERDSSSWDWHGPWIHQYGRRKTKSVGLFLTAVVKTQLSITLYFWLACRIRSAVFKLFSFFYPKSKLPVSYNACSVSVVRILDLA